MYGATRAYGRTVFHVSSNSRNCRSGHDQGIRTNEMSNVSPVVPRTIVDREIGFASSGEMICTIQRGSKKIIVSCTHTFTDAVMAPFGSAVNSRDVQAMAPSRTIRQVESVALMLLNLA